MARVVWVEGLVQDWGLFPSSDLAAKVLVQCSFSPSGYDSRSLSGAELGALWDIPISVLDALPAHGSERILQDIFWSAPTKILFAGTNFLLTLSFRGGLGGLRAGSVLCAGPRPLSNSDLGLVQSSGEGQLPFQPVEVIKGDSQKADDAAVPDQLWLHAFSVGNGDPQCQARPALGVGGASTRDTTERDAPPPGWQVSMAGFRAFGLRFWRWHAVWGYFNWRRNNIPWQSTLATPAQMVRWRMGMVFGSVRPVYE